MQVFSSSWRKCCCLLTVLALLLNIHFATKRPGWNLNRGCLKSYYNQPEIMNVSVSHCCLYRVKRLCSPF